MPKFSTQNIIIYASVILSAVYLSTYPITSILLISLLIAQIKTHCLSVFYHRLISHRSFKTNKIINWIGCTICALFNEGSPFTWKTIHSLHHLHTDKKGDPHSPKFSKNIFHFFNLLASNDCFKSEVAIQKNNVLDDYHIFLHKYNHSMIIGLAIFLYLIFGFESLVVFYLLPMVLGHVFMTATTYTVHKKMWGSYKKYEMDDNAYNNIWIALLYSAGEGMHNNHHKNPKRMSFQEKWYEIDTGSYIARLIKKG